MNKSVSTRNLIGGFLGGTVGILSSWYLDPIALPFGVLLGVVVGWWNEDIVRMLGVAHQQAKKTTSSCVAAREYVVSAFARLCGLPSAIVNVFRWIIDKAIVALASAPTRFTRWLARHPMNRVRTIDVATFLMFVFGLPVALFFLEPYVGIEGSGNRSVLPILGIVVAIGGSVIYRVRHDVGKNPELNNLGQFYREWEVISRHGSVGFLLYTIAMQIRYMIGFVAFVAVAVPWFVAIGLVGFLGMYPFSAGILIAQGFYRIASRSGHWLCLGVTMAVTGISWIVYHESLADPRILWVVALGTGIVSGGITEFTRRFILMFYSTAIGRKLAGSDMCDFIYNDKDDDEGYVGVIGHRFACMWFRHNRLARMFRAICFDTPVAQPVAICFDRPLIQPFRT